MAQRGCERREIAVAVGVSLPTLRKAYVEELAGRSTVDLFAITSTPAPPQPAPPPPPRVPAGGRKSWEPSPYQRERAVTMIAGGAKPSAIAHLLGITEPTFRKAFAAELEFAADVRYAEMLEKAHRLAMSGKTPAWKAYMTHLERAMKEREAEASGDSRPTTRLGKKEAAAQAAQQVAGKFAPRPPPPVTFKGLPN